MEIGDELARKGKIYYCFISRIIEGRYFEIACHNKSGITSDCSLLYETLSLFIMARCPLLAAKIRDCREIQKVEIRVELCHTELQI